MAVNVEVVAQECEGRTPRKALYIQIGTWYQELFYAKWVQVKHEVLKLSGTSF